MRRAQAFGGSSPSASVCDVLIWKKAPASRERGRGFLCYGAHGLAKLSTCRSSIRSFSLVIASSSGSGDKRHGQGGRFTAVPRREEGERASPTGEIRGSTARRTVASALE